MPLTVVICAQCGAFLTFKRPSWYLNFCALFMKNVGALFEQKKDKIIKQMAFGGKYNRDYGVCLENAVSCLVA